MQGGLKQSMTFVVDSDADTAAARNLADRVSNDMTLALDSVQSSESQGEPGGLEPPSEASPLPGQSFFESLQWSDLRKLQGDTYVQVPRRLE